MIVQDLMDFYDCKTQLQLCDKIDISRVTLWKWKKYGIPYRTQTSFQVETQGQLKATEPQSTQKNPLA